MFKTALRVGFYKENIYFTRLDRIFLKDRITISRFISTNDDFIDDLCPIY